MMSPTLHLFLLAGGITPRKGLLFNTIYIIYNIYAIYTIYSHICLGNMS